MCQGGQKRLDLVGSETPGAACLNLELQRFKPSLKSSSSKELQRSDGKCSRLKACNDPAEHMSFLGAEYLSPNKVNLLNYNGFI